MTKLTVQVYNDDINKALRKFKNKVKNSGKLDDCRKHEYYEKPTTKRKREKAAAVARYKKQLSKQQPPKRNY